MWFYLLNTSGLIDLFVHLFQVLFIYFSAQLLISSSSVSEPNQCRKILCRVNINNYQQKVEAAQNENWLGLFDSRPKGLRDVKEIGHWWRYRISQGHKRLYIEDITPHSRQLLQTLQSIKWFVKWLRCRKLLLWTSLSLIWKKTIQ